jgi:trehalose-phosphatase
MRTVLSNLARTHTVAIVSGRGLRDVQARVQLDNLYYAGSHGFEIAGPNNFYQVYGPANDFLAALDTAARDLHQQLATLDGVYIEKKHFAIAVHFRQVAAAAVDTVTARVAAVKQDHPGLRQTTGKKILELRPDLDWHKGKALFWLLDTMGLDCQTVLPLYIGDDVTDEDAFAALQHDGIGIVVADAVQPTAARYCLPDVAAVGTFLTALRAARTGGQAS